jgi:membrane associated rhomboid family serine protease
MMTPAVRLLLWTNVGVFLAMVLVPPLGSFFTQYFGLRPAAVLTRFWLWQPFTYMFLHGGIGHILLNMLVLWMFGTQLERIWGSRFFLRYYFITGVGAGLATIGAGLLPAAFAEPTYVGVTIGASGAIYGLLVAFALHYPNAPVLMFFLFPVPARYFVMIIGAIAFLSVPRGGGVAHIAHLGGLVVGYLYLKRRRGAAASRFGFGRLGIMADIKYRYLRWRMERLRKRFEVYPGRDGPDPDDRIH